MWLVVATVLCSIAVPLLAVATSKQHVLSFLSLGSQSRALNFPPNEMSAVDVASLICLLIWKALQLQFGLRSSLASRLDPSKCHFDHYGEIDLSAHLSGYELFMPLRLHLMEVKKYVEALQGESKYNEDGTDLKKRVASTFADPAQLSLFFSAISEPAFLILLARRDCPIQPLGAVNVRNHFELIDCSSARQMIHACFDSSQATLQHDTTIQARLLPTARVVKRGIEIDISVSVSLQRSEHEPTTIFTQIFTLLEFVRWPEDFVVSLPAISSKANQTDSVRGASDLPVAEDIPSHLTGTIKIYHTDPSSWASLCLDYNPIHHLTLAAQAAGFKGRLAHGNHVAARAVASAGVCQGASENGYAGTKVHRNNTISGKDHRDSEGTFAMDVSFKRPVVVGTQLEVVQSIETNKGNGWREMGMIDVVDRKSGKVCVEILPRSK